MDRESHWNTIYSVKSPEETSWHEINPEVSFDLIRQVMPASGRVIDVGGGRSLLAEKLLDAGIGRLTILDISAVALEQTRKRLGERAAEVDWIAGDITAIDSLGAFDVWHDRAVFHFLTEAGDRQHYAKLAAATLPPGAHLIIGAFARDGPAKCSGIEVCRYDSERLAGEIGPAFRLIGEQTHSHLTPAGKTQQFLFCTFQRK